MLGSLRRKKPTPLRREKPTPPRREKPTPPRREFATHSQRKLSAKRVRGGSPSFPTASRKADAVTVKAARSFLTFI
jgi:hypothetical protein